MKWLIIGAGLVILALPAVGGGSDREVRDREGRLIYRDHRGIRSNRHGQIIERRDRRGQTIYVRDRYGRLLRIEQR